MKSIIFASAWAICKVEKVNFSNALKKAWALAKENTKAVTWMANTRVKNPERLNWYDTIKVLTISYVDIVPTVRYINNDGASLWYDGKTFNND
jgi:hypothetical protein